MQTAIPFLFMRGGSSRGPYMLREHLPTDLDELAAVLVSALGSGHPLNIDGIGGGNPVTTKVAMLAPAQDDWADVDYFFAQVSVEGKQVDFKPTCGNILVGVGPAALELGLAPIVGDSSEVKIHAVNTGARVRTRVSTIGGAVNYAGACQIDGVPGSAAPVELDFMDIAASMTKALLPTGKPRDVFDNVELSCVDAAMPMCVGRATDFGLSGSESVEQLEANRELFATMERLRLQAGAAMGLGDCRESVVPKFGLLAPHPEPGHLTARYFMPWSAHPTMAVTGAQCLATCALIEGTVAAGMLKGDTASPARVSLQHPMGVLEVLVNYSHNDAGAFQLNSTGLVRTARKLAEGKLFVPSSVWGG